MPRSNDYHQQVQIQRTQRIREICKELPDACTDYFYAISQTTSALTRLAYAYDLRLFFQYLTLEQPAFAGVDPRLITTQQIGQITARQLRDFQDYLTQYVKQGDDQNSETTITNLALCESFARFDPFLNIFSAMKKSPQILLPLSPFPSFMKNRSCILKRTKWKSCWKRLRTEAA